MGSPVKLYQREMHESLGFFATWLPGDPIKVGDVGVLKGGRFVVMTSLDELGIKYDRSAGEAAQDIQYTSRQGTKVSTSAGATVAAVVDAEIKIEFSQEGAFIFSASNVCAERLAERLTVEEQILAAHRRDAWRRDWLVVDALYAADHATIAVSEEHAASLVLGARTTLPLTAVSLSDPKIGLSVTSTQGRLVHVVGGQGLRPLYTCLRLKDPLFGAPRVRPVRGLGSAAEVTALARPGIEELLQS